ncbi:MAG TPA: response regulator [Saprospiraceae bacterium]|nr:response regulator [Saprospiraceae bacterium]
MNNKIKLLIVDDDADDRMLFINSVNEIDDQIICITATDGFQALELLKDSEEDTLPSAIFLDLRMPRINGKKCLIELKKEEKLKHIPVIIYTTSTEVEDSIELSKLGAVYFISKPSNPEEIYYLISHVLEEQILPARK